MKKYWKEILSINFFVIFLILIQVLEAYTNTKNFLNCILSIFCIFILWFFGKMINHKLPKNKILNFLIALISGALAITACSLILFGIIYVIASITKFLGIPEKFLGYIIVVIFINVILFLKIKEKK